VKLELAWTKAVTYRGTYWRTGRGQDQLFYKEGSTVSRINGGVTRFEPEGIVGNNSDGVAIVSGGMDSTTLVYYLRAVHGAAPHLLSFDYGQRHRKELAFALKTAEELGLRWSLIDLSSITDLISNSALTSPPQPERWEGNVHVSRIEVPEGHYAKDNMSITVVPNRNMMMLSIAAAVAVNAGYKYVAAGMHAGDHDVYPDCRPEFLSSTWQTMMLANRGFIDPNFELLAPFADKTKNDIAEWAYKLSVPLHETWSCYKGGDIHCGRCGTCVERLEAVASVEVAPSDWDQTRYADTTFWKAAVASASS